jgi:hypothetical protein
MVISHDVDACTLRFNGHFYDDNDGLPLLPRVARMSGVGIVRILEKVIGPSTSSYGNESDSMAIDRVLNAAALSAPFEPIPEPSKPSELELQLRIQEKKKLEADRKEANKKSEYDPDDFYDICWTPSHIIDIRYEKIELESDNKMEGKKTLNP